MNDVGEEKVGWRGEWNGVKRNDTAGNWDHTTSSNRASNPIKKIIRDNPANLCNLRAGCAANAN